MQTKIDNKMLDILTLHIKMLPAAPKRIFLAVLFIKIATSFFIAPELYTSWFVPFVKNFVASGFQNPWDSFLAAGGSHKAFPYGMGMLLFFTIPFGLKSLLAGVSPDVVSRMDLFLMKIPVILADLGILYMLVRQFKLNFVKTIYVYWCSPVIFYISYIHGQLDIIPMMVMLASIVLLVNNRFFSSAIVLGFGLATKASLLFAAPFMIIYALRKDLYRLKSIIYPALAFLSMAFLQAWVFFSEGYRTMVLQAEERTWIYLSNIPLGGFVLYLIPLAMGLLFFKFCLYSKLNRDILIMYIGLTFTVILLFIPFGTPGWYMWIIPFLCYFYINTRKFHVATLVVFSILFILLFIVRVPYPIAFIEPDIRSTGEILLGSLIPGVQLHKFSNLVFTFLQGTIAWIAVTMYIYGVRSNKIYKERKTPVIIGIGGNSGSGKDTLCRMIKNILGEHNILQADGDDHHRWERGHMKWKVYTHLDPKANELFLQFKQATSLKQGISIEKRFYDHDTGKFSNPQIVEPNKYILVSGLHPFYLSRMRNLIDLKIYLDTDDELRAYWKIKRDMEERQYTREQVLSSMKTRETDGMKYIEPQRKHADMIIRYGTTNGLKNNAITESSELCISFTLDNSINIEDLICELEGISSLVITHKYEDDDKQHLLFKGTVTSEQLHDIVPRVIPNLHEIVSPDMKFEDSLKGIAQAIFLCLLSHEMHYEKGLHT